MGKWGSYSSIPKAIFYLLKGDYRSQGFSRNSLRTCSPKAAFTEEDRPVHAAFLSRYADLCSGGSKGGMKEGLGFRV